MALPLGLNLLEQVGLGLFHIMKQLHRCVQAFRIFLEPFPQFLCRRIL